METLKFPTEDDDRIINLHPGKSAGMARDLLMLFDGMPVEDMKTVLSGVTIALIAILMRAKRRYIIVGDRDGLEKMVLRWMAGLDEVSRLKFSSYINIPQQ